MPIYLDENGEPIEKKRKGPVYLDENGEPIESRSELKGMHAAAAKAGTIEAAPWYTRHPGGLPSVTEGLAVLPAAGGLVGGIAGASGGVPGAIAGAALGGGAGEAARQLAFRALGGSAAATSGEAAKNIAKEAAIQGVAELGGRAMTGAASRALAPGARSVDRAVLEAAERQGVEMPAAALSKSKAVPFAEGYAATGPGGGAAARRYVEGTAHLTAMAEHTVARASTLTDDIARGEAVAKGLDAYKAAWIQTKNRLFREADKELPGLTVTAPETVKLLDGIIAGKEGARKILQGGPVEDSFYAGLRDGLTKPIMRKGKVVGRALKPVGAKDLQSAMRELDARIQTSYADPFAAANKGTLQKLSATMDDEFMTALRAKSPNAASKLEAANRVYQDGINRINSSFGESIYKFAQDGKYDLIAKSVANSRMSVADVPRIMAVAGPDGTNAIRASVLADIVGQAKGASGQLTPAGLSKTMRKYGEDRLVALLTPEQYARLRDLATLSTSMEKGAKVMAGSPTAGKARMAAYGAAASSVLFGHPAALAYVLGDLSFNKFIGSRVGQRWLTTGYLIPGPVKEVVRQVPRAAESAYEVSQAEE